MNHQPTQIAILGKETKSKLAKLLVEKHSTGTPSNPDYAYCPKDWSDVYKIDESNAVLHYLSL